MRDPDFDATFIKTTTAASQKSLLPSLEILTLQARRDDMSNNRNVLRTNVISRYDVGASKLAHLLRLLQHLVLSRSQVRVTPDPITTTTTVTAFVATTTLRATPAAQKLRRQDPGRLVHRHRHALPQAHHARP
ncbi:hypothetical protein BST61_g10970 [Cercospora zeina]